MTLEELAEHSGLSPNFIGGIERGQRDPSLSTILALAKALKVPAADLIGGQSSLTAEGIEAARAFELAPADVQDAVLALLRAVSRRRR